MSYDKYRSLLDRGDELCRSREIPMPSTVIQEVKGIYKKWKSLSMKNIFVDTPLIQASRLGLANMVWGFIQYAKQTNTNLDTDETGELQMFLGYKNWHCETALDVAIEKEYFQVVEAFVTALGDLSWQQLTDDRNDDGKTLLSLFSNHEFDEIIFKAMKAAGKGKVDSSLTSISISVDEDNHQESNFHTDEQLTTLNKLENGELELASRKGNLFILELLSKCVKADDLDTIYKKHRFLQYFLHLHKDTTLFGASWEGHLDILELLINCVKADDLKTILEKHPSLVYCRNHQKETLLFVASREGRLDILELLINCVKVETDLEELVTRSTDMYTALHIAIVKHHAPIVYWLVNRLPQLANRTTALNESPLYFAAQRGYRHILRLILDESEEKSFEGPDGKTALHAAVMSQESVSYWQSMFSSACVRFMLMEKIDLLYIHDKTGWAPFHYAVYHDIGEATEALLEKDPNIGSLDINDSKGRNILHVAVENKRMDSIKKLFGNKRMANQKDSNGNTPLHLFMASDIEIDEMRMDSGVDIYAINNEKLTTLDVASSYEKRHILIKAVKTGVWRNLQTSSPSHVLKSNDSKSEIEKRGQIMTKFGDSLVVVTALIATATFAAAFTVPGGFDGNEGSKQGMPILLRKTSYKAFVVSNALAFSCACCVLFGYMRLQIYLVMYNAKDEEEEEDKIDYGIENIIALQYMLTGIAMVAMASAFITGTYVILAPSLAFAISLCATCVCIIVPLSFLRTRYFQCFAKLFSMLVEFVE